MRNRYKNELTLKDAIEAMLNAPRFKKLGDKLTEFRIIEGWKKNMGPYIMQYTSELNLKDHVLYVRLTSSVLRKELSMSSAQIIEILNKEVNKDYLKKIVFL
ncbi:MAG: DUF721 domain-containing protein [Bacteroidota bacterium]|nr:DUF721 domain-containing protein [Bacteroidota bacterium]